MDTEKKDNSKRPGEELKNKKVLVTGATGFVGGHLTSRLLEIGADVRILVRKSSDQDIIAKFKEKGATVFYGDIVSKEETGIAADGADYIFHIAALFRQAKHDDSIYFKVNVDGTKNILEAAEKNNVERLLHCSTVGVHSHILSPPADESEAFRPGDIYQETKCEGEKLARDAFTTGRVKGAVIRPAMIWGEGDKRMLKLFKGVSQRKFPVIGSGKTLTHWVYVHDLVDGFILAAVKESAIGQTYILAGRRPASISELVETVAKCAKTKALPFKVPAAPVQMAGSLCEAVCKPFGVEPPLYRRRVDFFTKDRHFNTSKAENELGYAPSHDFEDEVENIYKWYEEQGWL